MICDIILVHIFDGNVPIKSKHKFKVKHLLLLDFPDPYFARFPPKFCKGIFAKIFKAETVAKTPSLWARAKLPNTYLFTADILWILQMVTMLRHPGRSAMMCLSARTL